jgi:hypothetical protein
MQAHGGAVHAVARAGGGTVFRLELLLTEPPPAIEPETEALP